MKGQEPVVHTLTDAQMRAALGGCYICGDPVNHDGEPHGEVTGDGLTRAMYDLGRVEAFLDTWEKLVGGPIVLTRQERWQHAGIRSCIRDLRTVIPKEETP